MSVELLNRAATTAGWLTAVLRGSVGVEQALDVLSAGGSAPRFVTDASEALTLPFAVARWRQLDVTGWLYLPVAPGDAAGLPSGPPSFSTAALDRGVALVSQDGPPLGLLVSPDDECGWDERALSGRGRAFVESPAEAERILLEALNGAVTALEGNELASWEADAGDVRDQWAALAPMPPRTDARSERLALRSRRILELLERATSEHGGGRTAAEMAIRRLALAEVSRAARHAHAVAWNTGLRPAPDRG